MTWQVYRSTGRKISLQLASLCLLGLYPVTAVAQSSSNDKGSEPLAVRSARSVNKAHNTDPVVALRSARLIYVQSTSLLVRAPVIEAKLQKRPEFSQMGLIITRDSDAADVILEVQHDVFTKYVYIAIDRRTNMVLATGKLSSLGGTVAGKVAKRFLKQVLRARATAPGT